MKNKHHLTIWLLSAWFVAGVVHAADNNDEDTLIVLEEGTTPDDVMNVIQLPFRVDGSATATTTANEVHRSHEDFGQGIAEEVRPQDPSQSIHDALPELQRPDARDMGDGRRPEMPERR